MRAARTASAAVILALAAAMPMRGQSGASREYQVKAVFLFNFAQFVEWPADAFASADAPLVIGVLGDDPFAGALEATVQGERVAGHPLVVEHYRRPDDIGVCHILFVARPDADHLEPVLARLGGRPVLTVGDVNGFTRGGGMIRFVTEQNHIRLRINVDAATAANLTISSQLLRPAQIVTRDRP